MPKRRLRFLIIDDDPALLELYQSLFESRGHIVTTASSSTYALEQMASQPIDCIICDLMLPDLDGAELFQLVRKTKKLKQPAFIVATSKQYEFDMRRTLKLGINGYFIKPINVQTFVEQVLDILKDKMVVQFWGVRGTLPVPGRKTVRYGGNTNCVSLTVSNKLFIFDAGTGIKVLSNYLMEKKSSISAKIFISHPHWDHINGIPFFVPLYVKGNEFEIFGASHGEIGIEKLISDQMDSVYFPVTIKEFAARISFKDIKEESFYIDDVHIQTMFLIHPGRCLGYRIRYKNRSFCYVTDTEIYLENSPLHSQFDVERLIHFIQGASVLIIDSTYSDAAYPAKVNWGHSSIGRVIEVADRAQVKLLCLYHHDPDQTDKDIAAKLKCAKELLKARGSKMRCIAPREGQTLLVR